MNTEKREWRLFGIPFLTYFAEVVIDGLEEQDEPDPEFGSVTTYPIKAGFVRDDLPTFHLPYGDDWEEEEACTTDP